MTSGTLYGLGIGPGDPELLTLKAVRILKDAPVIAYPAPDSGDSLARAIAQPHLPTGRTEIAIRTPMVASDFPVHEVYDRYANEIVSHLDAGQDVAVLCEGDPFLYGSFIYIFARLVDSHTVEVVPGVSSLGACAAAAGAPLVSRSQVLTIVPAPLAEDDLEAHIKFSDAVAIMKVGRHLEKVRRVLRRLGLEKGAHYVEHATMNEERVLPLARVNGNNTPYFSMILVRKGEGEAGK